MGEAVFFKPAKFRQETASCRESLVVIEPNEEEGNETWNKTESTKIQED